MSRIIFSILLISLLFSGCADKKRSIAISRIKAASKLATTKTTLNKMIFATQDKRFLGIIKINQSRFAARTKAIVLAGVDLSKLEEDDVHITEHSIRLTLPAVSVLDFSYPFSEYKVDYNLTKKAFANTITVEQHEELYRRAESQIREMLPYSGIKEETEKKTKQLLESLLQNLGYTEIYISFKPGKFIEEIPLTADELQ
jgi:hypothetical protein